MPRTKPEYRLNWVSGQLAVGNAPLSYVQLESIRAQGVDAILNLCGEFTDLHEIEARSGFEVYYMPLRDEEAPELAELEKALAWLDEAVYLGKRVLIHCRHGIGRTGTLLNSYLLRRGLGHRLAGKRLKGLVSKPANFNQWWTVRKYGRQSGQLTIREPSLEFKNLVDLSPFFNDYAALAGRALAVAERAQACCGPEPAVCCRRTVNLHLAEAVHLAYKINSTLTSRERLEAIERAVAVVKKERAAARKLDSGQGDYCLSTVGENCPLLVDQSCLVFEFRPLKCRMFGLAEDLQGELWNELDPALEKLSKEMFLAFTSSLPPEGLPLFALPDVVSGRYVQTFFHLLTETAAEAARAAPPGPEGRPAG
ncbi:MAG: dual specificity protein phosphatase family protein [Desulfovibrionaceae bacterium]|nr:dual specificity protein phosphatase family protein [Desulfovibrionaceae bacterium]